jgi:clathrin heavy chain
MMQIFDTSEKCKIKSHEMKEEIKYWTWISTETIGIITEKAVYHWTVSGNKGKYYR